MNKIIPNENVLPYYFYFMKERMNMFWRKCNGDSLWTTDPILSRYKFTNVYRICDRVSQYLVRNVIYKDLAKYTAEDVLLRILIFKIFNKIETWTFLQENYGEITRSNFDVKAIATLLSKRQKLTPI
ncbi:MAG: putative DNA base hypermodification protein, partial [Muribaculum sp.]|nr:putative DNA base hypermodification protein [Muribaculum sp.]